MNAAGPQPSHSQPASRLSTPLASNILPNLRPSPPATDPGSSRASVVLPVALEGVNNKRNVYSTPSWLDAARRATSAPNELVQSSIIQNSPQNIASSLPPPQIASPSPSKPPAASSSGSLTPSNRGRPKGWRPGMSYAEMRGNQPPSKSTTGSTIASQRAQRQAKPTHPLLTYKKRRRPAKAPTPPPHDLYRQLKPRFFVFLCEWRGCRAELQNMETLRKHLQVVHRGNECYWRKCTGQSFVSLQRHVEEKHLVPLSWHVGDGPQNKTGWKKPQGTPEFLKDRTGKQVTPSTKHQEVEDPITYRENRRKLKELHLRIQENMPTDNEEDDGSTE